VELKHSASARSLAGAGAASGAATPMAASTPSGTPLPPVDRASMWVLGQLRGWGRG
jgi:hypothetical protein